MRFLRKKNAHHRMHTWILPRGKKWAFVTVSEKTQKRYRQKITTTTNLKYACIALVKTTKAQNVENKRTKAYQLVISSFPEY